MLIKDTKRNARSICYVKYVTCAKLLSDLKDTHRNKAPSNKTTALTKSTNMGIWVVGTNQLFIRSS